MSAAGRLRVTTRAAFAGRRLDDVVGEILSERLGRSLARGVLRRLLMAGAVRREGRPLRRPGLPVEAGWRLEILVDPRRLETPRDAAWTLEKSAVLFEDAWLIAVAKPSGLPTVPTADPSRDSLVAALTAFLEQRGERPYLAVHQRLDRETSGVVLFGRHESANAGLARAFAGREVVKVYEALTHAPAAAPPERFEIRAPVDGKPALTEVHVRGRFPTGLFLEARPRTGRKHQIRAHLAGAGLPILGDARHGAPPGVARVMLHARRLELRHPVTGAPLAIECPPPADFRRALAGISSARSHERRKTRRWKREAP